MGCFSDREKGPPDETAKWTYITLSDFRCTSAWTVAAYAWLWCLAMVGVAVYVVDTYTAVNLLAFNHWSSKVQPKLDFKYSKWIFAGCILLSWALCIYEWVRAIRVIKRGGVAESFLDPLAVNIQSMRKQGWKRFLVFTELTKSKKGADYVALFAYFSFKSAIRVILAEGPRQVVNGLTLSAVMEAQLLPGSTHDDSGAERNNFDQFWFNVQTLADENRQQAIVYFAMLFTLCIWVFSALSLIISFIMYILFLWHYIPQRDGRLSSFCKRKVDKRLAKIVEHKVKLGIEKEQRKAEKAERKAELQRRRTGEQTPPVQAALRKQPTLPDIGHNSPEVNKEKQLRSFPLVRQDTTATVATLPPYSVRPPMRDDDQQPTLPRIVTAHHPGMPMRSVTQSSGWSAAPSYSTNAPLLANAGHAGGSEEVPLPPSALARSESYSSFQHFHGEIDLQGIQDSRRAFTPAPASRAQTPLSARPYTPNGYTRAPLAPRMPVRSNTTFSVDQHVHSTTNDPLPLEPFHRPGNPPNRSNTADGVRPQAHAHQGSDASFRSLHSQKSFSRPIPARNGSQMSVGHGRAYVPITSTVPEMQAGESYELQPQSTRNTTPAPQSDEYVAFKPSMQTETVAPIVQEGPQRNILAAGMGAAPGVVSEGVYSSNLRPDTPQYDLRHSNYAHEILDEYRTSEDEDSRAASPVPVAERSVSVRPSKVSGRNTDRH